VVEAVVYVDPLPDALQRKWARSTPTLRIIQQERRFFPRVVAVAAGTTIRFQNRDDVYHNVFSVSPAKKFDIGKYPPHAVNQVTFDRPGVVNLYCDIHPKMAAYVLVLPHRFFTRPERDGGFSLPSLPAGSYTLRAWHPAYGRIVRRIQVPEHGDIDVPLRF
jgi:plastocyanin